MDMYVISLFAFVPCLCVGLNLEKDLRSDSDDEDDGYIRADGCKFTVVKQHALYGHNDEVLQGLTQQECLEKCAQNEACLSLDRNVKSGRCILSHSSKNTNTEDFGTHGRVDYYHKVTCEAELAEDEEMIDGQCIKTYGPFGGNGGEAFSDKDLFLKNHGAISKMMVKDAHCIDCMSVTYGNGSEATEGPCHGGDGGFPGWFFLQENEYVKGLRGMATDVIEEIVIVTNVYDYGPFGIDEGDYNIAVDAGGRHLAYISGRAGRYLNQLSLHFHC